MSSNIFSENMNNDKGFVILTKPISIHGISCFSKDSNIVAGICEPDDSKILLEIKGYARISCSAKRGKWKIELPDIPNDLFQLQVRLATYPQISETSWMVNYVDRSLVLKEIDEDTSSFIMFAVEIPPVYKATAIFQVVGIKGSKIAVIKNLTKEQVQRGTIGIEKDKLNVGENILFLVMRTPKENIYSTPISVDNIKNLSDMAIAKTIRIGELVKDFYSRECKGLSAKKAGKKIVDFLKKQKGLKNIKFQGFEISWETQEGIGMVFSLAPPEVD